MLAAQKLLLVHPYRRLILLEGPGEILIINESHAQLRFRQPVPDVWLRLDQLEPYLGC